MPYYKKDDESPLGFVEASPEVDSQRQKSDATDVNPPNEFTEITQTRRVLAPHERPGVHLPLVEEAYTKNVPTSGFHEQLKQYEESTDFFVPDPSTLKKALIEFCKQQEQNRQPPGSNNTKNLYPTSIDELKQKLCPEEKKRNEKFKTEMKTADTLEKVKNLAEDFFTPKPAKTRWNTGFIGAIRKFFSNIFSKIYNSKPKVYPYQKLIAEAEVTSKLTEELEKSKTLVESFQALATAYQATQESWILAQHSTLLGKDLKDFIFDQFKVRIDEPLQAGKLVELPPQKIDAFHHRIIRLLMAEENREGLEALPLVRVKLKPKTDKEKEALLDETLTKVRDEWLRRIPEESEKGSAIQASSKKDTVADRNQALKKAAFIHRDKTGLKGLLNRKFRNPKSENEYYKVFDDKDNVREERQDYLGPGPKNGR